MKMHGLGNDFVVVDERGHPARDAAVAIAMADRHRGVGFDQLAVLSERRGRCASDVLER